MVAKRRAAAARLVMSQAAACQSARRRNMAAAREAMAVVEQRQQEKDQEVMTTAMAMARQCREHQYPLPSYQPREECDGDMRTFTSLLEDVERHRRQVHEDRMCCHHQANIRRSNAEAGPSNDGAQ
jgi:hypothetical protein